jgi:predicted permease
MNSLWYDLRSVLRGLARSRRFVGAAVAVFVLAIAANATIYTLADRLYWSAPALVEAPEELVRLHRTTDGEGFGSFAYPDFVDYRAQTNSLAGLMAFDSSLLPVKVERGQAGDTLSARFVSWNFFDVLGVRPAAGRWFLAEDEIVDAATRVAVLSEARARRLFAGDPNRAIGEVIRLNGQPFTVVGVAPHRFHGVDTLAGAADLWLSAVSLPLLTPAAGDLPLERIPDNTWVWLDLVGRLAHDASAESAQVEIVRIAGQLEEQYRDWNEGWGAVVTPGASLHPRMRSELESITRVLLGSVAVVLLIAVVNLSILFSARAAARSNELRTRLALGAGRRRLLRLLVIECLVVGVLGAAGGFALAHLLTRVVVEVFPYTFSTALVPDLSVLSFSAGLGVLAGLCVGWLSARGVLARLLRESLAQRHGRTSWRPALLIATQVALATLLVVSGALLTRSLREARGLDLGFDPSGITYVDVNPSNHGYEGEDSVRYVERSLAALQAVAGFDSVSTTQMVPFRGRWMSNLESAPGPDGEQRMASFNRIGPGYFATMSMPMVAGREFSREDRIGGRRVAVVNRALAELEWPGESALGKTLARGEPLEIVGVVENATYHEFGEDPVPHVFLPALQDPVRRVSFVIASRQSPETVGRLAQRALESVDSAVAVQSGRTLSSVIDRELGRYRTGATMIGLFAVLALVLASAGLYAVLSYRLLQQLREVGVRVAVGASPRQVATSQLGRGLRPVLAGLAVGLLAALGSGRFLDSLLFGVEAVDPFSYGATAVLLLLSGLLACAAPTRRALRVDPVEVLRAE